MSTLESEKEEILHEVRQLRKMGQAGDLPRDLVRPSLRTSPYRHVLKLEYDNKTPWMVRLKYSKAFQIQKHGIFTFLWQCGLHRVQ